MGGRGGGWVVGRERTREGGREGMEKVEGEGEVRGNVEQVCIASARDSACSPYPFMFTAKVRCAAHRCAALRSECGPVLTAIRRRAL